jgi:hypothetical protein
MVAAKKATRTTREEGEGWHLLLLLLLHPYVQGTPRTAVGGATAAAVGGGVGEAVRKWRESRRRLTLLLLPPSLLSLGVLPMRALTHRRKGAVGKKKKK